MSATIIIPDEQIRKVIDGYLSLSSECKEEILTTSEACEYLGISSRTLQRKTNAREIAFIQKDNIKQKLFLKSELNKYLRK